MMLKASFDKWKVQNNQHGRQAFSRFIMLHFLDGLQDTSEDFVFKGGNLLWHYIKTPRETTDLDLATISLKSHIEIKSLIERSFERHSEIQFVLKEFKELDGTNDVGAALIISFSTKTGQKNQFSIDIVYATPTDIIKVKSTLDSEVRKAASLENIICDKLSAYHQFKSGNTRMKDYDDLWRIAKSRIKIDPNKLKNLLIERKIPPHLDCVWISFLDTSWKRHRKSYKDIPASIEEVFVSVNEWIDNKLK